MNQPSPHPTLRTAADVLADFRSNGITIAGWCRENGFSRNIVNALLHHGLPGRRGQAHLAAIALGMKAAVSATPVQEQQS